jgi:hypothetical protein
MNVSIVILIIAILLPFYTFALAKVAGAGFILGVLSALRRRELWELSNAKNPNPVS